ncbi:MAG TPA: hypothetical protein PK819_10915, partial [Thermomicrobiales bacterium]|nr:hypothetical protein [Thermomicrobiales bacterium]
KDYTEYDFPYKTAPDRLRDLRDNLPIIKDRLAKLNPAPIQNPFPILIGGGGEKVTLKLVAQYADMWNGFGTPEEAAHKLNILDQHCAAIGRNPQEIERSIMVSQGTELATAQRYEEIGVTTLIMGIDAKPSDLSKITDLLTWRNQND